MRRLLKLPKQMTDNIKQTAFPDNSIFSLLAVICLIYASCNSKIPVITSINPKIGELGEIITLTGSNFGALREESYVTIAGSLPTNSSYRDWQDTVIQVRIPDSGESGLVYVHVKGRKSNGVLFSNSASVPRLTNGDEPGIEPRITSVTPRAAAVGTMITITGNNFGSSRENGGVFFSWDYDSSTTSPFAIRESEFIEVSDLETGYDFWSSREIRVRIPDGAINGNLEVRTPRGKSRPFLFDVSGKPGNKTFKEKCSYTVTYSVDIRVTEASKPNTLYLWIPLPAKSPSQRNISIVNQSMEPLMDNYRGVSLFKLENLAEGTNTTVSVSYNVEVYTQETVLRPLSVRENEDQPLAVYTAATNLIPSNEAVIKTLANTIAGRERNPYLKGKMLYDWMVGEMRITETSNANSIIAAAELKQSDPYTASLLFCAMARASGLPAIPVAGVLVNRNRQTIRHYWAEYWVDNFGWIPVDPAMGSRAVPDSFIIKQDAVSYYFGNIDSQRIAFSRGDLILSQIESRGRMISHPQSYSHQNIWEEAVGGLDSYSSLWGDIIITGIYVQ
jgi:transglutaminase-like putative cysteine protease